MVPFHLPRPEWPPFWLDPHSLEDSIHLPSCIHERLPAECDLQLHRRIRHSAVSDRHLHRVLHSPRILRIFAPSDDIPVLKAVFSDIAICCINSLPTTQLQQILNLESRHGQLPSWFLFSSLSSCFSGAWRYLHINKRLIRDPRDGQLRSNCRPASPRDCTLDTNEPQYQNARFFTPTQDVIQRHTHHNPNTHYNQKNAYILAQEWRWPAVVNHEHRQACGATTLLSDELSHDHIFTQTPHAMVRPIRHKIE